jgi:hypothetical protein
MNWKGCGRSCCSLISGTIATFGWRNRGRQRNVSFRIAGFWAEVRTRELWIRSRNFSHTNAMLGLLIFIIMLGNTLLNQINYASFKINISSSTYYAHGIIKWIPVTSEESISYDYRKVSDRFMKKEYLRRNVYLILLYSLTEHVTQYIIWWQRVGATILNKIQNTGSKKLF